MTDESDIDYAPHVDALLDGALGPQGYYGVFTANMHTDDADHAGADAIVAAAKARGVPVVSAAQMLDWLDGRNDSSFDGLGVQQQRLQFTIQPGTGRATACRQCCPVDGPDRRAHRREARRHDRRHHAAGPSAAPTTSSSTRPPAPTRRRTASRRSRPFRDHDHRASRVAGEHGERFSFASNVAGATFQCRLDSGAFMACGSPAQFTGLAAGQHTSRSARPAGRRTDSTPAARDFTDRRRDAAGAAARRPWRRRARRPGHASPGGGVLGGSRPDRSAPAHARPDAARPERTRRRRHAARDVPARRGALPREPCACGSTSAPSGRGPSRWRAARRSGSGSSSGAAARRRAGHRGSLRVTAVAIARDDAGNEATVRTAVRSSRRRRADYEWRATGRGLRHEGGQGC